MTENTYVDEIDLDRSERPFEERLPLDEAERVSLDVAFNDIASRLDSMIPQAEKRIMQLLR